MGDWDYDLLILLNQLLKWFLVKIGRKKYSLPRRIENSVKSAMKFISNFERTAVELAVEQGYKYVICGHIHQPKIARSISGNGSCLYLNSGDWVENLTALEYNNKKWVLVNYRSNVENNSVEKVQLITKNR